ncbi:MAG: hypothetical protein L6R39_003382 [Caloplaca ligustica]|nr:MAG: hypothetical protein L6R39_003382 [Caloplaca ligustica]
MSAQTNGEHYQALVDIGSNGIRFSISDLSPSRARVMPTVYQDRWGISLYDAQYDSTKKVPIPDTVISDVVAALLKFKRTCEEFRVPSFRIRVLATEATRTALNSENFRQQIEKATGWKVEMLAKEEEGRIGAMGVASSFESVKGLVMDLGGGSIQMTWMISKDGQVKISPKGAVSYPYGAAALKMRLEEVGTAGHDTLRDEISANFKQALQELDIPQTLLEDAAKDDGLSLYLSGGGFRGFGYILMSLHSVAPYPIPIINGFRVPKSSFLPVLESDFSDPESIFRISARRASQVPAIAFLIKALTQAIPSISYIYFAQGGIREGLMFSSLSPYIQSQHPLVAATQSYAPSSTPALFRLFRDSIPRPRKPATSTDPPSVISSPALLTSVIHLLYAHSSFPKDIRAAAALRSTTTGLLGDAHGLSHIHRALLALVLCERWGSELSATDEQFFHTLQGLAGPKASWWAKYIGRAAAGIGDMFPSGVMRDGDERRVKTDAWWLDVEPGRVAFALDSGRIEGMERPAIKWRDEMNKVGKRKVWIGGREGWGLKVEARLESRPPY